MRLNDAGRTVQDVWNALPDYYACVTLDAFVMMPNHLHGIIILNDVGAQYVAPNENGAVNPGAIPTGHKNLFEVNRAPTVGEVIRSFKARCTRSINRMNGMQHLPVWQRNYYEHIIRNESSLREIREYIANNPGQWATDRENPDAVGAQFIASRAD